ncbi:hypothetical protein R69776_03020 [Paraburkholderia nemoris]|uniref:Uncharacterized protein n=1 Tax=Paraburkholderia nemoris TaxID=2793076 RepID=A0ABN7LKG1_9BURK|nr:hypothetical protein R69776_03020 [Paraburkholderia nemoris]CAE6857252.1 hypothetical protein R75777_07850 [Paraburkholderia nemoris]
MRGPNGTHEWATRVVPFGRFKGSRTAWLNAARPHVGREYYLNAGQIIVEMP